LDFEKVQRNVLISKDITYQFPECVIVPAVFGPCEKRSST
jgi:hypothetical protein